MRQRNTDPLFEPDVTIYANRVQALTPERELVLCVLLDAYNILSTEPSGHKECVIWLATYRWMFLTPPLEPVDEYYPFESACHWLEINPTWVRESIKKRIPEGVFNKFSRPLIERILGVSGIR